MTLLFLALGAIVFFSDKVTKDLRLSWCGVNVACALMPELSAGSSMCVDRRAVVVLIICGMGEDVIGKKLCGPQYHNYLRTTTLQGRTAVFEEWGIRDPKSSSLQSWPVFAPDLANPRHRPQDL